MPYKDPAVGRAYFANKWRNDPAYKKRKQAWWKANRRRHMLKGYKMSVEEYDTMLAAQGGHCLFCTATVGAKGRRLHVDHDHKTNRVRGLLCGKCNTSIGRFEVLVRTHGIARIIRYIRGGRRKWT